MSKQEMQARYGRKIQEARKEQRMTREELADRVGIMAEGRLCALGTPQELIARSGAERFEDAFLRLTGSEAAK